MEDVQFVALSKDQYALISHMLCFFEPHKKHFDYWAGNVHTNSNSELVVGFKVGSYSPEYDIYMFMNDSIRLILGLIDCLTVDEPDYVWDEDNGVVHNTVTLRKCSLTHHLYKFLNKSKLNF